MLLTTLLLMLALELHTNAPSINLPGGPRDYCLPAGIREHERERERERERESSREMAVLVGAQGMQTQRCRRE